MASKSEWADLWQENHAVAVRNQSVAPGLGRLWGPVIPGAGSAVWRSRKASCRRNVFCFGDFHVFLTVELGFLKEDLLQLKHHHGAH